MSVAKVIEISAQSPDSFDAAIREGIDTASKSLRNIQNVWVKEQEVEVKNGRISAYRVDLKVTFVLE